MYCTYNILRFFLFFFSWPLKMTTPEVSIPYPQPLGYTERSLDVPHSVVQNRPIDIGPDSNVLAAVVPRRPLIAGDRRLEVLLERLEIHMQLELVIHRRLMIAEIPFWRVAHGQDGLQRPSPVTQPQDVQQRVQCWAVLGELEIVFSNQVTEHDGAANRKHVVAGIDLVRPLDIDMSLIDIVSLQQLGKVLPGGVVGAKQANGQGLGRGVLRVPLKNLGQVISFRRLISSDTVVGDLPAQSAHKVGAFFVLEDIGQGPRYLTTTRLPLADRLVG